MLRKFDKKKRGGFTLTEIAIVLGVFSTLVAAIWSVAGKVNEQRKGSDAFNEMQTVVQNILALEQGRTLTGPFPVTITSNMITAQAIPSYYVSSAAGNVADHPWSPGNFVIQAINAKTFRVSFYQVTRSGCDALLAQATLCQAGQSGCPSKVWTNAAGNSATPNAGNWQLIASAIDTLCGNNTYPGTNANNSVEFDFAL